MDGTVVFDRVCSLLVSRGMTIKEAERKIGLANGNISRWKMTAPNLGSLLKMASYFDVSIDYLVGRTDVMRYTREEEALLSSYRTADIDVRAAVLELLSADSNKDFA